MAPRENPFSPLIIGEWTATLVFRAAGQTLLTLFQSPNHRGVDCNRRAVQMRDDALFAFSPLIIGEWTATVPGMRRRGQGLHFQSPNHRGVDCNRSMSVAALSSSSALSVP